MLAIATTKANDLPAASPDAASVPELREAAITRPVPCLTFEELISVDSISAVAALYAERGITFKDQSELISKIKADWCAERERLYHEALKSPAEVNLKPLTVDVDGSHYEIFGIYHPWFGGKEYYQKIMEQTRTGGHIFSEQNIGDWYLQHTAQEIPDHLLFKIDITAKQKFLDGLSSALLAPVAFARQFVELFKTDPDPTPTGTKAEQRIAALTLDPDFFIKSLAVPQRNFSSGDLPAYAEIELQEQAGTGYESTQARSAYMAEFLRAWPNPAERRIVVGGAHAPEIEYFLKRGTQDERIIDLARRHVALYQAGGEPLRELLEEARVYSLTRKSHSGYALAGALLGAGAYVSGIAAAWLALL